MKDYQIRFDGWGLTLFLFILLPNLIWLAVPAPDDILRLDSMTRHLDAIALAFQILLAVSLVFLKNRQCPAMHWSFTTISTTLFTLLYYMCWWFYYQGHTSQYLLLGLCVFPCLALLFFAIARKNWIALIFVVLFSICHLLFALVNFWM